MIKRRKLLGGVLWLVPALLITSLMGLSACGGGSSGGSSSPTASSVTGIYTGGTTLAYFHLPGLIDPAYASGYSPTKFTLTLNSSGQFSIADDQGNVGGGTYTISGSSVTISSGTLVLNSGSCTQSSTTSCSYTIQSGTGGLTVSSGNISGTLDFFSSSNTTTPAFSTTLGLSVNSLASVSLSQLENQTFTLTFGTATAPNPSGTPSYNCTSPNALAGTTGVTVNGSTVYVPCVTWNTYMDGNTIQTTPSPPCSIPTPCSFLPYNDTAFKLVTCPTLGSTCYPTSFPSIINNPNYPTLSVPTNALAFYAEATSCPSGSCSGGGANVGGYIVPASGSGGGVVGKFFTQATYCSNTTQYVGTISVVVSTSGSVIGSYFLGAGIPNQPTYTCGNSTYNNYPVSFTAFTTTQY